MRILYKYITMEQKEEVVKHLRDALKQLDEEFANNGHLFSPFIRNTLFSVKEKWTLEVEYLENEINDRKEPK